MSGSDKALSKTAYIEVQKLVKVEIEHVISSQKGLRGHMTKFEEKVNQRLIKIEKTLVGLKFKSGIWGAIGAAIPVAVTIIWLLVTGQNL